MAIVESDKGTLSGAERAAILLMTLGEQDAAEVLKHMSPKEVQKIGKAMVTMFYVTKDDVSTVLSDFCDAVEKQTELGIGNEDYLHSILTSALGENRACNVIDRIMPGSHYKGLYALKWMDPRAVVDLIQYENPQIIAIVLSYLEQDQAAEVLANLSENMRADVMIRVASLDGIQPNAIHQLNDILENQFSDHSQNIKSWGIGGLKTAANILNSLDSSLEGEIIEQIREIDGEMVSRIQELMFVFESLFDVNDRVIQDLLREISSDTLILALRGADNGIKEKIFKNMPRRAGEMLRDDLEARGPVKLSEVQAAQKEILTIARRMAESGEISLRGKNADEYV